MLVAHFLSSVGGVLGTGVLRPRVLVAPSPTHAFPGENVILYCQGDHYTESYEWLYSGQPLPLSSRLRVEDGVGLHIQNVTMKDSGVYTCVCVGREGSENASAVVNVTGPLLSCSGTVVLLSLFHVWYEIFLCRSHNR